MLVVFMGGGLGAILRYSLSLSMQGPRADAFPYPTLVINLIGALLIGTLSELFALKFQINHETRLFLIAGVLGGFTTYSAFALESIMLIERGAWTNLIAYVLASAIGSIIAALVGIIAMRQILS
jgi:CrcB protein